MVNNLNPILYQNNFLTIRWYGLFLGIGVFLSFIILQKLFKKQGLPKELIYDLFFYLFLGGIIGARLGYVLFYNIPYYIKNPVEVFFINHGGLSSHGLALGLLISFYIFIKLKKVEWKKLFDLTIISIPLLAMFVRIGNFFNSEIVGRATNLKFGVKFPSYELNPVLRHPIQLYEALAYLILFILLLSLYPKFKNRKPLIFFHLSLLLIFSIRFILEFFKEFQIISPDYFLTIGQILSLPFILWSIYYLIFKR